MVNSMLLHFSRGVPAECEAGWAPNRAELSSCDDDQEGPSFC